MREGTQEATEIGRNGEWQYQVMQGRRNGAGYRFAISFFMP